VRINADAAVRTGAVISFGRVGSCRQQVQLTGCRWRHAYTVVHFSLASLRFFKPTVNRFRKLQTAVLRLLAQFNREVVPQ